MKTNIDQSVKKAMELALIDNQKMCQFATLVHFVPVPNINKTLSFKKISLKRFFIKIKIAYLLPSSWGFQRTGPGRTGRDRTE